MSDSRKRFEEVQKRFHEVRELFPAELDLVMIEEAAEEIARRMPKPPKVRETVTRTVDEINKPVVHVFDVIKTNVPGHLREVALTCASKNFDVMVLADGVRKLYRSYEQLEGFSPFSETIDAFQDVESDLYTVRLSNMNWTDNFLVSIRVKARIIFNNVVAFWDEYI